MAVGYALVLYRRRRKEVGVIVHGVQPDELESLFPFLTGWLVRIPRLNEWYKLNDVYKAVLSGDWQLWTFMDKKLEGVLLTTIVQLPLSRELRMIGIAGNRMEEWRGDIHIIENYARANDCDRVVMLGARKGFGKVFPDYKGDRVILEKKL